MGDKEKISINCCSGGCVHITVGNVTLNFLEDDFLAVADRLHQFRNELMSRRDGKQAWAHVLKIFDARKD